MNTDIDASRLGFNLKQFCYDLNEAGVIRQTDEVNSDGKIHHTELGLYQIIVSDDGHMTGRWQKWGDKDSYYDSFSKGPGFGISYIDKAISLRGEAHVWDTDWQDYIAKNEKSARLKAWSSDSAARTYANNAWTVHQFVPASGISWVYGSPGCLKSFFAVDLACHVATGRSWAGRKVRQGPALYVSAEGGGDIHLRRVTWERDRGEKAEMLKIASEQPQLDSPQHKDGYNRIRDHITEIEAITGETPALIVLDTFAQTASDDTKDVVSRYTRNLTRLIQDHAPNAAILVIDHTTKEGGTWMGSVAKLGNTDMMCLAKKKGDTMTLSMSGGKGKIKGAAECDDIKLTARVSGSGIYDTEGQELNTLVLDHCTVPLNDRQSKMLSLIGDGETRAALRALWDDQDFNADANGGARRASFNRALEALEGFKLITVEGTKDASMIAPL